MLVTLVCGPAAVEAAGSPAPDPAAGGSVAASPASAQPEPATEAERLRAELLAKMAEINAGQRALLEQMEAMERKRRELELMMAKIADPASVRGGSAQVANGGSAQAPPAAVGSERKAEIEAEKEKPPEIPRISAEVGGVLTPKGRLVLEPSVQYVYSSVNRVSIEGLTFIPAFALGRFEITEADRDTIVAAVAARYGLTNRLETEIRVPYVWRRDSTRTREILEPAITDTTVTGDANDIGDIEFDIRYQIRKRPNWPYLVANVRTKVPTGTDPFDFTTEEDVVLLDRLPTGTGFWTVNPSMTFIYPSDPVVFFGNLGYLWTMEDDKGGRFEDVDPGDAVRMNFGMGFGLNDRTSFSLSYSLDLFNRTTMQFYDQDDILQRDKIAGSDVTVGKFLIGFSMRLAGGTPLNLSIGIGSTEDAPDTDITFRVPFTVNR